MEIVITYTLITPLKIYDIWIKCKWINEVSYSVENHMLRHMGKRSSELSRKEKWRKEDTETRGPHNTAQAQQNFSQEADSVTCLLGIAFQV
jgi:hypothetical protein